VAGFNRNQRLTSSESAVKLALPIASAARQGHVLAELDVVGDGGETSESGHGAHSVQATGNKVDAAALPERRRVGRTAACWGETTDEH
jgi:hypothetical protein